MRKKGLPTEACKKKRYYSKREAREALNKLRKKFDYTGGLRIYTCKFCHQIHLGRKNNA